MNLVMAENGDFVEVQGTAEGAPFSMDEMNAMIALGQKGISELVVKQKSLLAE